MTLKGMLMLGGVLAGAAYLQDKQRRDRLVGRARDALDRAKSRAADISRQVDDKIQSATTEERPSTSYSTHGSPSTYR